MMRRINVTRPAGRGELRRQTSGVQLPQEHDPNSNPVKQPVKWPWLLWLLILLFPIPWRPWWLTLLCFTLFCLIYYLLARPRR